MINNTKPWKCESCKNKIVTACDVYPMEVCKQHHWEGGSQPTEEYMINNNDPWKDCKDYK